MRRVAANGTAVVLAAHGSRRHPSANAELRRHAEALERRGAADRVTVAFHHGEPGFDTVLDRLGADRVLVIPFFTSAGYYTEQVLPAGLRRNRCYHQVRINVAPPIGAEPGISRILARRAAGFAQRYGLDLARSAVLLAGHGTRRHPGSRETALAHTRRLDASRLAAEVGAGFLDDDPAVEATMAGFRSEAVVALPFLIGGADHADRDLPGRLGLPVRRAALSRVNGRWIGLDRPLGADTELTDIAAGIIARDLPAGREAGWVALIGAGPGDPGLLTVRGLDLLQQADVILADRLVSPELLQLAAPHALLVDVGKRPGAAPMSQRRIEELLVEHARRGRNVVRLKGGDPFVFGRGAEEMDACREAGIECRVVPGVTSAIAVPAAAGIAVTERSRARSFAVVTARTDSGPGVIPEQAAALSGSDTLVILMGRSTLAETMTALVASGRDPSTPVACIQDGTTRRQRVVHGTLTTISERVDAAGLESPMVTVVGAVAARAAVAVAC